MADQYLLHITQTIIKICRVIGESKLAQKYQADYDRLLAIYHEQYVTPAGRILSESQTALALALKFNLFKEEHRSAAVEKLVKLVRKAAFKIGTGFAGTPWILLALSEHGKQDIAQRMFQEKQCPSLLYCVSMGATTIWER